MTCCLEYGLEEHKEHKMNIYENIMQGLTEAADYQQGKINARKTSLTVKLVDTFNNNDIKQIRQRTDLSNVCRFAGRLSQNSISLGKRSKQAGLKSSLTPPPPVF